MYQYKRLSEESLLDQHQETPSRSNGTKYITTACVAHILCSLISFIMFISAIVLRRDTAPACSSRDFYPQWSPVLEAVKNTGYTTRFDGSFATPNAYKGPPSPEIDRSWSNIQYADGGVLSIDEDTLIAVNASREYSVKLAPEIGGGYMASVEVLHQLHCLNMLRQATYEEYYRTKAPEYEDTPEVLRWHLDHCIDNLRQKLMCEADTGILTYVWVKGHKAPFPDFSVQHKCRSFNAVKDWVRKHQVFTKDDYVLERQPGALERETPP